LATVLKLSLYYSLQ